ncbi:MAG: FtsX-like permease family protein [Chloroflexota bacterium]|nr:FtsX-like permease family protein [Chloroflexota bacterium]
MRLQEVVFKDAMRRRKRLSYTALGVMVGVAAVIAVMTIANAGEEKIYEELDKYGANLVVSPSISDVGMQLGNLDLGNLTVGDNYIDDTKLPEIRRITDDAIREEAKFLGIPEGEPIATIAPKLYVNTEIEGTPIIAVGFDPEEEAAIKTWWEITGRYPEQENEIIVGQTAAELLEISPGDTVVVEEHTYSVVGVLGQTGSEDDYEVFIPLESAQSIFNKSGLVSSVDIRALCNGCPVEMIADSLNNAIPGIRAVAVKQIASSEMGLMDKMNDFLMALASITLVVGTLGVVNTMTSSVHERVRDIGIMKAVGASRRQIVSMFLYEAVIVGLLGGVIGYIAGTLLSYLVGPLIFDGIAVNYVIELLPAALGIAIAVAVIASVYPAFRASQIKVADSMRSM